MTQLDKEQVTVRSPGLEIRQCMARPAALLMMFFCSTFIVPIPAHALEDVVPFLPGVTIGVPVGALPPPGLYYSNPNTTFSMHVKNDMGQNIGVRIQDTLVVNQFLYVPVLPPIFGATYGAFIAQPVRFSSVGTPGGTSTAFGVVNTVVSPLNLSWNLHNGFFVSAGLTTYVPDSDYHAADPIHIGRNYFTAEPGIGLSYLANGWNLTLHPNVDVNTTNPANGYHSGAVIATDYTASHRLGKFDIGIGGTLIEQFTDDKLDGVSVAAIPGIHGQGNRARNLTVGPVVGYDFGAFALKAYYTHSVYARNTAAGDQYWVRFDVPLYSANPAPATRKDLAGPH